MDRLCSTLGDTTLAAELENCFSSIPIGSKIFYETYDEILLESVAYYKSIEQKRIELLQKKMKINREKFDVIKDSILNKFSEAPWSEYLPGSFYFNKVTTHLRKAPSKATKKGLQAIANDILQKNYALFAFVKMDFLFSTIHNSSNQSHNSYAITNNEGDEVTDDVRKGRRNIPIDFSFEVSLKEQFNRCYANNKVYRYIEDRPLH
jgi:hypothetical protein